MYYIYNYCGRWVDDADEKAREFGSLAEARDFIQRQYSPSDWDEYLIVYAVEFYHATPTAKIKKVGGPL